MRRTSREKRLFGEKVKGPLSIRIKFNPKIDLPEEVKDQIKNVASWNDTEGWRYPREWMETTSVPYTRSVIVDLPEPTVVNGRTIRAIKIKGTVLKEHKEKVRLPEMKPFQEGEGVVPGLLRSKRRPDKPMGSMLHSSVKSEFAATDEAFEAGMTPHIPLANGRIYGMKFPVGWKKKKVGFTAVGLEDPEDRRADQIFYNSGFLKDELQNKFGTRRAKPVQMKTFFEDFFRDYGMRLRELHETGRIHGYPNLPNATFKDGKMSWADFGSSHRYKFQPKIIIKKTNDLLQACDSIQAMTMLTETGRKMVMKSKILPIAPFMEGYFHEATPAEKERLRAMSGVLMLSPHINVMMDVLSTSLMAGNLQDLVRALIPKKQ